MKKRKKPLSILMVWIMLFSIVPITGFAAVTEPTICAHIHEENCYAVPDAHVCSKEASCVPTHPTVEIIVDAGHIHQEDCFERTLTCGMEEREAIPADKGYSHGENCYEADALKCEKEEHTHEESCYEKNLICSEKEREAVTEQQEDTNAEPIAWDCGAPELVCEHKDCAAGEPCLITETPDVPLGDSQEIQSEKAVKADMETASIIADDGYSFDTTTGELTLLTSAGTTAWRSNAGIAKTDVISLVFDPAVTQIGREAFSNCTELTGTLIIPSTVTDIGYSAFQSTGITGLDLFAYSGAIGSSFSFCTELTGTLVIPAGVTRVDISSFQDCSKITAVDWQTEADIPKYCFYNCSSLSSLTFHKNTAPAMSDYPFYGVPANGTLTYPAGATGYSAANFPDLSGWTFAEDGSPAHVPVENITGIPTTTDVRSFVLDKYVEHIKAPEKNYYSSKIWTLTPGDATNQKVKWAVTDAGSTEAAVTYLTEVTYAYIDGVLTQIVNTVTTLSITSDGTLVLTATVTDGIAPGQDYTQDFTITVIDPANPDSNGDGYHDGDVAVINAMIIGNGLTWRADDPASWPTSPIWGTIHERVEWNGASPKRITSLDIFGSNLTGTLNVSGLTALTMLNCQGNELTGLDVSGCSSLKEIKCIDNNLTGTLDVSGLTALERLWCDNNDLTAINVSGCTALKRLICSYNNLTTLDVSNLTTLQELRCFNNGMTTLDVSGCTGMTSLSCSDNALTSLNVSGLTALTNLNCYNNDLTELNVSGLTALKVLSCYGNSLTTLNMSGCTEMGQLWCYDNALTTLDVSGLTKLFRLHCYNNDMSSSEGGGITGMENVTAFTGWSSNGNFRYSPQNTAPIIEHTISVSASPSAGGTVTGGGTFDANSRQTVTATANSHYAFVRWTENGHQVSTGASYAFTLTADRNLVAEFRYTGGGGDPHTHTYGTDWNHDANYHWHECSCGDIADKAAHDFGGWIIDKEPTETEAGSRHRDCTVCAYQQSESIKPTGPAYTRRTLSHQATGIQVSGYFTSDAALEVKEKPLHTKGDCSVCDDIRARQKKGELIVLFDISLKSGKFTGDLIVEIPVGEEYNDQRAIILHCKDKVLESRTVTVENGVAKGTFSGLSPFAVAKVPGKTAITGLPERYTLLAGKTVSWTPAPTGGEWSYDKDLLEMTRQGDTYTFKALKEGKATATYIVDGVPHTVTITINSSTLPQTGDTGGLLHWLLVMLAALAGCGGLLAYRKFGCKKRHG